MRSSSILTQILVVLAVALALRLSLVIAYPPAATPEIAFYRGDAPAYHRYAASLAAGVPYDQGLPFHPPLLAWLVTPIYRLTGSAGPTLFLTLRTVMSVIGAVLAVLTLLLARRLGGPGLGLWVGALVAVHFGLATASTTLNTGTINLVLALAALLLVATATGTLPPANRSGAQGTLRPLRGHRATVDLFAAGLLAGLAALARAEDQLLIILLAAFVVWRTPVPGHPRIRERLWPAAMLLTGALVVIVPWSVRNAVVIDAFNQTRAGVIAEPLGRLAPITCYGALNFALANHPEATGGFSRAPLPSPGGTSALDLRQAEHLRYMNHGFTLGLDFIVRDPGRWLRLVVRKCTIGLEALQNGYGARNRPAGIRGLRRAVDLMGAERRLLLLPHLLLIALGIWVIGRRHGLPALLLLHLPVIVKLVALVGFFGYVRLVNLMLPILLIDMAVAVAWTVEALLRRTRLPVARAAQLGAVAALVLMTLALAEGAWLARHGQEISYYGENAFGTDSVNLDGDLELWPSGEAR